MQFKCIIAKEIMPIGLEETNHVFKLLYARTLYGVGLHQHLLMAVALISKRNDIDQNQFRLSFVILLRASMSIFIKKYFKQCVL